MGLAVKNGLGRTGDGLAPSDIARLSQVRELHAYENDFRR